MMDWHLVSNEGSRYFHFAWNGYSALYSTKHGQDDLLRVLKPIFLKQIHSDIIVDVDSGKERTGDGLVSSKSEYIGLKIADCLPVYLFALGKVCIIHCGWRGIIRGIARKAQEMFKDYHYVLGASINICCYEVKQDVADLFKKDYAQAITVRDGKYYIDLKSAVIKDLGARRLLGALDLCTKCHPEYFYSNRNGDTQRNYALLKYGARMIDDMQSLG